MISQEFLNIYLLRVILKWMPYTILATLWLLENLVSHSFCTVYCYTLLHSPKPKQEGKIHLQKFIDFDSLKFCFFLCLFFSYSFFFNLCWSCNSLLFIVHHNVLLFHYKGCIRCILWVSRGVNYGTCGNCQASEIPSFKKKNPNFVFVGGWQLNAWGVKAEQKTRKGMKG